MLYKHVVVNKIYCSYNFDAHKICFYGNVILNDLLRCICLNPFVIKFNYMSYEHSQNYYKTHDKEAVKIQQENMNIICY